MDAVNSVLCVILERRSVSCLDSLQFMKPQWQIIICNVQMKGTRYKSFMQSCFCKVGSITVGLVHVGNKTTQSCMCCSSAGKWFKWSLEDLQGGLLIA
ncbi:ankyrin repeat protein [Plakobranchus ocellatus]|uniref:Ankyrin repeat protein n=1 Tax=Plakobranchus ocellatus TaxID=259542 RepID=A0AAV4BR52_9GAST|nr:ankyrin repeat protein [Plakobranchus ocellatus]